MSAAAMALSKLQRRVARRKQWLALQDRAAIVTLIGGLLTAVFVLLDRLQLLQPVYWVIFGIVMAGLVAAFAFDWYRTRASKKEAAFLIDGAFDLEDRVSTAHEIIARGKPEREVEAALLEDAATRVADKSPRAVVPYRLRSWHALSLVGVAALVAALMIPERVLPGGDAMIEARADIQNAGEQLEQVGEQIALVAPSESATAKLAKEQAELGRALRRAPQSRAEALQKLSALEDRIRQRHSELANTRADEIVSIAQKRLGAALQPKSKSPQEKEVTEGEQSDQQAAESDTDNETANTKAAPRESRRRGKNQPALKPSEKQMAKSDATSRANANRRDVSDSTTATKPRADERKRAGQPTEPSKASSNQTQAATKSEAQKSATETSAPPPNAQPPNAQATNAKPTNPQNQSPKPVTGEQQAQANNNANANPQPTDATNAEASDTNKKSDGQPTGDQNQQNGEPKPDANKELTKGLTGMMADQAAKALPKMSEALLKKAAELRAGQLTPADIKGLQQAAESLARDLSKIAQSKELQQVAEQLAKQITPEMIEQFARALGNQEQLKQELQAAAQLLMQNQQAKTMVAGLAQKFAKIGEELGKGERRQNRNRQPGNDDNKPPANDPQATNPQNNPRAGRGKERPDDPQGRALVRTSGGLTERAGGPLPSTGKGVETKLNGNVTRGTGGDYLFLKSRAGGGVARAPYSSAYPQYRREAERTVERSQVPPHLRSVVRGYFDAINPDATRKP